MQQQWTSKNNTGNWKILSCSSYVEREIHYQIEKKKEKKKNWLIFICIVIRIQPIWSLINLP